MEDIKFMQLGGNCACIGYLGTERLRGPVDNVILKDVELIKLLIENKYYTYLINSEFKKDNRTPGWKGDSPYFYKYSHVWIAHHNPLDKKYQEHLKERISSFNIFLDKVRNSENYYFTININEFMIDKEQHTLKGDTLEDILKYLININLKDKVIFVSTKLAKKNNTWNYYSDDAYRLLDKYKIKHITIYDNDIWDTEECHKQFLSKAIDIIKNNFKIDLILPYVDSTDKSWQELFNKYKNMNNKKDAVSKNRFRGMGDFFRYFFRCIQYNMPWINNIYLIVQSESQIPIWLNTNKVKIVYHKDFIPEQFLPTFNSGTIEMFIQNINSLEEHFIYANDDIFALKYMSRQDFFIDNYTIFNYLSDKDNHSNIWRKMCQNNHDLIYNTNNAIPYLRLDHEFRPYIKSKMLEVYNKYKINLFQSISQFRESKNLTIYLFSLYLIKNNLQKNTHVNALYLWSEANGKEISSRLAKGDSICINDTSSEIDIYNKYEIKEFFYKKFNFKSDFEITNWTDTLPDKRIKVLPRIQSKRTDFIGFTDEWWKDNNF